MTATISGSIGQAANPGCNSAGRLRPARGDAVRSRAEAPIARHVPAMRVTMNRESRTWRLFRPGGRHDARRSRARRRRNAHFTEIVPGCTGSFDPVDASTGVPNSSVLAVPRVTALQLGLRRRARSQGVFPPRLTGCCSSRAFPFGPRGLVSARFLDERRVHWQILRIPKTRS